MTQRKHLVGWCKHICTYVLHTKDKIEVALYHHRPQAYALMPHAGGLLTKYYITPQRYQRCTGPKMATQTGVHKPVKRELF